MDEYLKEIGVGMLGRMAAKTIKPRLIISETDGKWTIRTETNIRRMSIEFIPDVEYEEITADGRELKVIVFVEYCHRCDLNFCHLGNCSIRRWKMDSDNA